jgi:hypothetical protein
MKELFDFVRRISALCNIILLVFIVLKLVGTIDWSWWWVTSPLWGQCFLGFVVGCFLALVDPNFWEKL